MANINLPSNPHARDEAVYTVTSHNGLEVHNSNSNNNNINNNNGYETSQKISYCHTSSNASESSSISYTTNINDCSKSGPGRTSIGHLCLFFLAFNPFYGLIITPFRCIRGFLSSATRRRQVPTLLLQLAECHGILSVDLSCLTALDLEAGGTNNAKHQQPRSTTHHSWDWQTYADFVSCSICKDPAKTQATIDHLESCITSTETATTPTRFKLLFVCLFFIPLASLLFFLLGILGLIIWTFELLLDDDDPSTVVFLWTWWQKCVKIVS